MSPAKSKTKVETAKNKQAKASVRRKSASTAAVKLPSTGTTPKIAPRKIPVFKRGESDRYVRIPSSWRYPKGIDNKSREKRKGWPVQPGIGYRNPRVLRGLHPSGLKDRLVYRPEDLVSLDPDVYGVRIAKTVGIRKRLAILDKADELGLIVFNPSRVEAFGGALDVESIEDTIESEERHEKIEKATPKKRTSETKKKSSK
ncbi:MAG: 50S ribosomal protein L32e [Candidatus Ranarchaeia archaeon]